MPRFRVPAMTGLCLLVACLPTRAADPPAGTWRGTFNVETERGETAITMLLVFTEQEGKWVADFVDASPKFSKEDPVLDLTVSGEKNNAIKLGMKMGSTTLSFEGKLQPDGKAIKGTLDLGGDIVLVEMVPSQLKSLTKDRVAVAKEVLDTTERPAEFFRALFPVISQASAKKLKAEEVRSYAEKAGKMAEAYGPRWQRHIAFRLADQLAEQEAFTAIAVEQARQGERLLNARMDDISTQLQTLDTLARVLRKAKKDAEAKDVEVRVARLEPRDYVEYAKTMPPFKPEEFKGRKGKSDRAVLVELFTGAECAPCVSVDLAFDSLGRTYKPSEVVLLQYHAHIPGPDPLVSVDGSARMDFYNKRDEDKSTPQVFINGKAEKSGGGGGGRRGGAAHGQGQISGLPRCDRQPARNSRDREALCERFAQR
jgi:hypothetical protein